MSGGGARPMDWNLHINNLIYWANKKGYHVEISKEGDDSICYISKVIEINSSSKESVQVIRLLHECGHVLIFEHDSIFNFKDKRDSPKECVAHKVFTVIEEIEAWKRGRELAKRLEIPIEEAEWESDMVRALKKYINWASDLKEKMKNDASKSGKVRSKCRNPKESSSK